MSWVVVGVAGASLVASQLNNAQQRADRKREMLANAEIMRNSPWTGMQTQVMGQSGQGSVGAGVQGAAQGAMLGSQFKKAFADEAKAKPNTMATGKSVPVVDGTMDQGNPYAMDPDWMRS